MTPKSQFLAALLLSAFLLSHVYAVLGGDNQASAAKGPLLGGWEPIKNPKAPEVVEAARFAVEEHNKQANSVLKYVSVVRGEQQVVAGMNYRLVVAAEDGGVAGKYQAVVYVVPWKHSKSLTSFKQI